MHKIHGTYCAALTPLNTDYSINKELFLEHCNSLLSEGLDGLALFGTPGEGNSFNVNEKIEAVNYLIDNNIGADKLIPGTGLCSIKDTVIYSKAIAKLKVKAILVLPAFYYKNVFPKENYLTDTNNPPEVFVEFFSEQNNLENITCYSNENNKWRKSKIVFENNYKLKILINDKFTTERGRINCSLNDKEGWRWFGIQFVIKKI